MNQNGYQWHSNTDKHMARVMYSGYHRFIDSNLRNHTSTVKHGIKLILRIMINHRFVFYASSQLLDHIIRVCNLNKFIFL